jgi:hypothetical protein
MHSSTIAPWRTYQVAVIVVGGAWGTLSEIELALRLAGTAVE